MQKIGNELAVAVLVTGRVAKHGDRIEVSAELSSVSNSTELWGEQYSRNSSDLIALQQQIASDIAQKLRSQLTGSEKQKVTKQGTQNPEAYQLYLKGRYNWNKRTLADLNAAISYFNQALDKDPSYATAYSGLADAYGIMAVYGADPHEANPKAKAAALKALELDPTLARPHAVLGGIKFEDEWDFTGGEAEYRKALELDPNDATTYHWYSDDILRVGGREQEAIAAMERAHELDPLSLIIAAEVGNTYARSGQFNRGIEILKRVIGENPAFARAHDELSDAYWGRRMYPEAVAESKRAAELVGDKRLLDEASALEEGFRSGGWKAGLTKKIEVLKEQRKTGYISPYAIARLYADLGDKEHAFQWLNTAYQEHDSNLTMLKNDFAMDRLRSDPRFAEQVRKVGLPQ